MGSCLSAATAPRDARSEYEKKQNMRDALRLPPEKVNNDDENHYHCKKPLKSNPSKTNTQSYNMDKKIDAFNTTTDITSSEFEVYEATNTIQQGRRARQYKQLAKKKKKNRKKNWQHPHLEDVKSAPAASTTSSSYIDRNFTIPEDIDFNDTYIMPALPVRFTKNRDIWHNELKLFTKSLTMIIYGDNDNPDDTKIAIVCLMIEYSAVDIQYKYNLTLHNMGLWPQHFIINESDKKLNEHGMILSSVRDRLIHSFNLQSIFEICGNCFANDIKMNKFFVYGIDIDSYSKHYHPMKYQSVSAREPFDGYTSTTGTSVDMINPLKFRIYSNEIMVCKKGFHIERHNEHYEESSDDERNELDEDDEENVADKDPSYFFTLLLLPPNQITYKGGVFRFYDVGDDVDDDKKFDIDINDKLHILRSPTPINIDQDEQKYPEQSPSDSICEAKQEEQDDVNIVNEEEEKSERSFIEIKADKSVWSWVAFDKRVEYEVSPIDDGTFVIFKMDIDVWKKTYRQIQQDAESQDRIKEIEKGDLNINIIQDMTTQDAVRGKSNSSSSSSASESPTHSANICFPAHPITMDSIQYL